MVLLVKRKMKIPAEMYKIWNNYKEKFFYWDCSLVLWLAQSPHSKKVCGLIPCWGLSVWSLHSLHDYTWVLSGYANILAQPKNMHVRLIDYSKTDPRCEPSNLPNVYPASHPMTTGIGTNNHNPTQPPPPPPKLWSGLSCYRKYMNKWIKISTQKHIKFCVVHCSV